MLACKNAQWSCHRGLNKAVQVNLLSISSRFFASCADGMAVPLHPNGPKVPAQITPTILNACNISMTAWASDSCSSKWRILIRPQGRPHPAPILEKWRNDNGENFKSAASWCIQCIIHREIMSSLASGEGARFGPPALLLSLETGEGENSNIFEANGLVPGTTRNQDVHKWTKIRPGCVTVPFNCWSYSEGLLSRQWSWSGRHVKFSSRAVFGAILQLSLPFCSIP